MDGVYHTKYYKMKSYIKTLEIPVEIIEEHGVFVLTCTKEGRALLDIPIVAQADSEEEAIKDAWSLIKFYMEYLEERSRVADRWQPFKKGNWGRIGGTWMTIFGIHIYFRRGKGMKGGWYVPFTKLNISVYNHHWKIKRQTK